MQNWAAVGRPKEGLRTPALLLDIDAVDRNLAKTAAFFRPLPCTLRPHVKTHKSPFIAHRQIRAGAIGITCAKLEDAKGFVNAGIDNVLVANEIPEGKMPDLLGLSRVAQVIACVDSFENASALSKLALKARTRMDVFVEVDVGLGRCGVAPGQPTLDFVRRLGLAAGAFLPRPQRLRGRGVPPGPRGETEGVPSAEPAARGYPHPAREEQFSRRDRERGRVEHARDHGTPRGDHGNPAWFLRHDGRLERQVRAAV
jgi:hypothetical protein